MGNVNTTGPNEVLVISGGIGARSRKFIVGGYGWSWWCISDVQRMSLNVITLMPKCESVETAQGVPITVTAVTQVKVLKEPIELLHTACEQFLGREVHHIQEVLNQTMEGHLRAILGTLSVEKIYKDRDAFADSVREMAAPDLGKMGFTILSFTIKDVVDHVDHLDSLGRTQIAAVKRDAQIGVAEANRDAGIKEADAEKTAMDTKYQVDAKIADSTRNFNFEKSAFDTEVNTAKAQAELAYELESASRQQGIRQEEIQIEVVERKKEIDIQEKEISRREKELFGTVRLPAEAEAFKVEALAAGKRTAAIARAEAAAERTKVVGTAEASALRAVGEANAERMRARAGAYKQYGNEALTAMVIEALPKIAAEVAAPLAKTKEIVIIGGDDRVTGEVTRLAGSLQPAVKALTGVDLQGVLKKAMT